MPSCHFAPFCGAFCRYDVVPDNSGIAQGLKHGSRFHGTGTNGRRNGKRRKMFRSMINKAKKARERKEGASSFTASLFEL